MPKGCYRYKREKPPVRVSKGSRILSMMEGVHRRPATVSLGTSSRLRPDEANCLGQVWLRGGGPWWATGRYH